MASPVEFLSANKRQRKANYADNEIRVLLEEVLLAKDVLFGSFNSKITIQEKNLAWDRVTAAINSCGVVRRSRIEIKEKWKTLKSEVIGRQRRAVKTGGGPPEPVLPYEDSVMQIIGCNSNLIQGVTAPSPASFVNPSVLSGGGEMGVSHTLYCGTVDEDIACTPSPTDYDISPSFSMADIRRPICSSTPLPGSSINESTFSAPFSVPVDVSSPVVVAELHDGNITVSAEATVRECPAEVSSRRSGIRRSRGVARSRKRAAPECTSDIDERVAFIHFLESSADESIARTTFLQAQCDNELVNATRMRTHTNLMEAQLRPEVLEIAKLEKELGNTH